MLDLGLGSRLGSHSSRVTDTGTRPTAPAATWCVAVARGSGATPDSRIELTHARANGYAVEYAQTRVSFASVAIPLTGATGLTTGALSITAPLFRADVGKYAGPLTMVGHLTRLGMGQPADPTGHSRRLPEVDCDKSATRPSVRLIAAHWPGFRSPPSCGKVNPAAYSSLYMGHSGGPVKRRAHHRRPRLIAVFSSERTINRPKQLGHVLAVHCEREGRGLVQQRVERRSGRV